MELQEVPYKTQTANTHGDILEQAFDTKMEVWKLLKSHEETEVDSDEDWADTKDIMTYVILQASQ